ncbi:hypothetical protein CH92_11860 [Stutzerimonas stutzeri]|uniref:Uncharacterized protein n=1 Tax=Stutzerimonas stutzeri TaxID=316 RepID=W8QYN3_STUST|nr:hypothetical protein [Stutzerimonas stutzeri]AHL75755.1 hypothetical protein CH92_11860 [Stutzerimonas stutzeri]MCQ4331499.1 hypothetical protein [Stutzerimonas stutzeri]
MTTQRIALDEAMRISEMAFLPCHATTKANNDDASFSLRVTNAASDELLSIPHIARSQYADPVHLAGLLEEARLQLSKDGVPLSAWSMPAQPGVTW